MSGGREIAHLPSTLVRVTSDAGLTGWGEVCPLGTTYLPAHAGSACGARTYCACAYWSGSYKFAAINDTMDATLLGYAYAKSPIEGFWDLSGKAWEPVSRNYSVASGNLSFRYILPYRSAHPRI